MRYASPSGHDENETTLFAWMHEVKAYPMTDRGRGMFENTRGRFGLAGLDGLGPSWRRRAGLGSGEKMSSNVTMVVKQLLTMA